MRSHCLCRRLDTESFSGLMIHLMGLEITRGRTSSVRSAERYSGIDVLVERPRRCIVARGIVVAGAVELLYFVKLNNIFAANKE